MLGETLFLKTMEVIFARLKFSGPTFWEDTDRGNLNIYFTQYQSEIDKFQKMQNELLKQIKNS